jgi:hypothetical protein
MVDVGRGVFGRAKLSQAKLASWSSVSASDLAANSLQRLARGRWAPSCKHPTADGGKFYAELIWYHEWMMGFVSGYNSAYEANMDDRTDLSALDVWLRNWCNNNPTRNFAQAGQAFREQMTDRH